MNGWHRRTLGEVCLFTNGLWKGEKPPFVNVGVIRNTNFTKDGLLDDSDVEYLDVESKKFEKRRLEYGDIILEKSGGGPKQPVGRVVLFDKTVGGFSFSNFTAALRVRDPKSVDPRFLHMFLHWTYLSGVTEGMQSHSTGIRNLDVDAYKAIEIALPPLPEQERIVSVMDRLFVSLTASKANAERSLENSRNLFQSYLQHVFSERGKWWGQRKLGDLSEVQSGGTPTVSRKEYWGGDIPWYSSGELTSLYTSAPERQITTAGLSMSNAKLFPKGSLLIGMYDTAALKMSILDRDGAFNQAIAGVKPRDAVDLVYVLYAISSAKPKLLLERRGVRQKNLSLGKIKDIVIPLPSLSEQRETVTCLRGVLAETERLESIYRRKLDTLEALKMSVLQRAFSGQL